MSLLPDRSKSNPPRKIPDCVREKRAFVGRKDEVGAASSTISCSVSLRPRDAFGCKYVPPGPQSSFSIR